jgi:hypothetical protein
VSVDNDALRNPLLGIAATVMHKAKTTTSKKLNKMATILHPKDFINHLKCSCPAHGQFIYRGDNQVKCQSCNKVFLITKNILELVNPSLLDPETKRELDGNTYEYSEESLNNYANGGRGSYFYSHLQNNNFTHLSRYLKLVNINQIFLLGCGTGGDIKCLSKILRFHTVYLSDLSFSALYITPYRLKYTEIKIGLFTANLDDCPIDNKDLPILIYEALHHTSDMHSAIERLLIQGYKHIFFVEPTNNLLIKWLAKHGLAQRIEYSGVKPGRLNLNKLYSLCKEYGYKPLITTMWHFPEDYYRKYIGYSRLLQSLFLILIDLFSIITRPIRFGNESIVYLQKKDSSINRF